MERNLSSLLLGTLLLLLLAWFLHLVRKLLPPSNFPRNIPTVPIYVSFLGLFTNMDQKEIFENYLRDHLEMYGAVKIYFASRWNILVTKPELLVEIFRDEETFAKSGNQIKIPYSVLSEYTGDNLISAHGSTWKLYRQILTTVIQFPDLNPVVGNSRKFVRSIAHAAQSGSSMLVTDVIQKFALSNIGDSMLGIDFRLFENDHSVLNEKLKFVKSHIFKPMYLNFPFLDKFPIPSRIEARQAVRSFRKYYSGLIRSLPENVSNVAGSLTKALNDGVFTEQQFTDNAMIVMIAGHENPQLLLTSLIYVLSLYQDIQQKLRDELTSVDYDEQVLDQLPYLNSIIYETLRMFPPLGQIINRITTKPVKLGDFVIPKGVYVGYNNFATGRDRTVWEDADSFSPDRWGIEIAQVNRSYSKAKGSARLPAFHGRKRACLGEKFALHEMKQVLNQLLKSFRVIPDPEWENKLTPGGPVSPWKLKVKFEAL